MKKYLYENIKLKSHFLKEWIVVIDREIKNMATKLQNKLSKLKKNGIT